MWVAGVLKGRERRDVMRSKRNLRFFFESESRLSRSESGRVRFRDRGHFGLVDLVNERGRKGREPAVNVKTESRGVEGAFKG
jgi:hypothetical protein